jgi:hypothetical protein
MCSMLDKFNRIQLIESLKRDEIRVKIWGKIRQIQGFKIEISLEFEVNFSLNSFFPTQNYSFRHKFSYLSYSEIL